MMPRIANMDAFSKMCTCTFLALVLLYLHAAVALIYRPSFDFLWVKLYIGSYIKANGGLDYAA